VDLVDEDELALLEAAEERDQLIGIVDVPREHLHQRGSAFPGEEPGRGGLAQAGLTGEERVSHGLAPPFAARAARSRFSTARRWPTKSARPLSPKAPRLPGSSGRRRCFGDFRNSPGPCRRDGRGRLGGSDSTRSAMEGSPLGGGELGGKIVEESRERGTSLSAAAPDRRPRRPPASPRGGRLAALDGLEGTGLIRVREDLGRGLRLPDDLTVAVEGGDCAVLFDAED
jgi:hypothetical protein